ncbi:MAG: hypothetical protein Q8N51_16825 [Gammaproteobacteria bacterium]|nr:hypothetical protein [Gammaproteobacteria bacterium]
MDRLPDPRNPEQRVYSTAHLVWLGTSMFLMHLDSRRQLRQERRTDAFRLNLEKLSGQSGVGTVADTDTLGYFAERMPPEAMEGLLASMTRRLIRSKALDAFRLYGAFTVAIDGCEVCTFDHEPWPGCPHRRLADGTTQYFKSVIDAKLVTPSGLALTLATETLTNEGHDLFDKQDCELKAFGRLVAKLRALFPRTPLVLLLDSLYANQNVFRLVESNRWKYVVNFKEGSMPERFAEAQALMALQPENALRTPFNDKPQSFRWINDLPVAEFAPAVIECIEQPPDEEPTRYVWLTNFRITPKNVSEIANHGGRLRWKIENEGFNVQKNDGYCMAHPFSEHPNGSRVFYVLLLIAHLLSQLILHGSLIESLARTFESAKNFARRLAESLRHWIVPDVLPMPGQIRFRPP